MTTLADLAKADFTSDYNDGYGLELAFEIVEHGYEKPEPSVGIIGGRYASLRCIGGRLTHYGEVALTREQVSELFGSVLLDEIEYSEAEKYAAQYDPPCRSEYA